MQGEVIDIYPVRVSEDDFSPVQIFMNEQEMAS